MNLSNPLSGPRGPLPPHPPGSGFRVQGSGFRVQGSGGRVQGPGSSTLSSAKTKRFPEAVEKSPCQRDWYFIAEQSARAPHLAHPEGCAALRIVLVTEPRVSRFCEHFLDGFDLHLLHHPAAMSGHSVILMNMRNLV